MSERRKFLSCLAAAAIALAPLPASAEEFEGFSLENLSVGLEFNSLSKGLDATTALESNATLPSTGIFAGELYNSIGKVKLNQVLARVNYQVNGHFTPYLLLGTSGLSFDEKYRVNIPSFPSIDANVPYSDSLSIGYGIGAEGVVMELPWEMKLNYGARMFTFTSSDGASVPPEEINSSLALLNPLENVEFSTDVTFREWDFSLGLSRAYDLDGNFTVIPEFGYRHSNIHMQTSTEVKYEPGMPNYLQGTADRSLAGSTSSVTLGVTGTYQEFLGATLLFALGDETSITLAFKYGF